MLRNVRISLEGHRWPFESAIVLVPMKLADTEFERRNSVQTAKIWPGIQRKPNLVMWGIWWPIQDAINGGGFGRRQAIFRRCGGSPADIGPRAEVTRTRIGNDAVGYAIFAIAGRNRGFSSL